MLFMGKRVRSNRLFFVLYNVAVLIHLALPVYWCYQHTIRSFIRYILPKQVNVQTDSDYPNKFLEGGRRMTWFGGSKMHR